MGFTEEHKKALLAIGENAYLNRSAEKKYNDLKAKDPFPDIPSALLNSDDIIKYILTTGMIDPFVPENLEGATYNCTFSGKYLKYDHKGSPDTKTISDDEVLTIESNSIAYLEIEERFMIPLYLVLRFNLKVQHVYKGLLLGTGPIIDPGFVGKLYIPLHNLTLNNYKIKKGAELICVEFTKLSAKKEWSIEKHLPLYKQEIQPLNFNGLPVEIQKEIRPDRTIFEYIGKSLQGEKFFKEPSNEQFVSSALANYGVRLKNMSEQIEAAIKKSEKANESINNEWEEKKNSLDDDMKEIQDKVDKKTKFSNAFTIVANIVAIVAVIFAAATMIFPTLQTFDDLQKERVEYHNSLVSYQKSINVLLKQEIKNAEEKLELLNNKYVQCIDKESPEAVTLNWRITEVKNEIKELKNQLVEEN